MKLKPLVLLAGACALGALSGCGLPGDLERAPPMWGNPPIDGPDDPRLIKQQEEEKARREAEKEAARNAPAEPAEPSDKDTPPTDE